VWGLGLDGLSDMKELEYGTDSTGKTRMRCLSDKLEILDTLNLALGDRVLRTPCFCIRPPNGRVDTWHADGVPNLVCNG
jgi:hypothetical protein